MGVGYPGGGERPAVAEPGAAPITRHQQLEVYKVAFQTARRMYILSKDFPIEERYSLTDQVRRSSRSVCANIAEAWRRRRYAAAFQNALNHAEAEAAETQAWIAFALDCGYIDEEVAQELTATYDAVIGRLVSMITHPEPWILPLRRKP